MKTVLLPLALVLMVGCGSEPPADQPEATEQPVEEVVKQLGIL